VTTEHERRLSKRKAPEHLTYIELPSGNGGLVLNVSEGGLAFQAVAPVKACGPIPFWFSTMFLSADSSRIEGTGELAWTDEAKKNGGLRFTQLSAGAREQIPSWPNESDRQLDSGKDSAVRPQWVGELRDALTRDESPPSITNETSTDPALRSGASPPAEVLRPEMDAQALWSPKKSAFGEHSRSPFKAICVSVLAITVAVVSYVYREAGKVEYTYQIPSPASNLSSKAAPVGDVFAGKSNVEGAPRRASPQSSSTAPHGTAKQNAAKPPAPKASGADSLLRKPLLPPGALMVQVGAFAHEYNARKVADSLSQKNFPAFVSLASTGVFYRVQVGPYADEESARLAQSELERAGFKPLIRH